jgi:hypothetical protein
MGRLRTLGARHRLMAQWRPVIVWRLR